MSLSHRLNRESKSLRLALLATIVICFVQCFWGQEGTSLDRIAKAKMVVRQLLPELQGRGLRVRIEDPSTLDAQSGPLSFEFDVLEPDVIRRANEGCAARLLVSFEFQFASHHGRDRLFLLTAGGPAVNTEKREHLNRLVDSHPEWSNAQITEVLERAGAQFGPSSKDDLLKAIPVSPLQQLIGDIKIGSATLRFRDEAQMKEHLPSAILLWEVDLRAQIGNEPPVKYYAQFEPFQGKLVSLMKSPPIP